MVHRFDASSAECLVFTYKEGLLSAVAHDLKIRVTKFAIAVDATARSVEASFDARSLRVVSAMQGTAELTGSLSTANKREIEGNIVRDVLEAGAHPEIRFVSTRVKETAKGYTLTGRLGLHGTERTATVAVRETATHYIGETRVHQPDFGIRPYTALLGALKVQADVVVRVTLPRGSSLPP